MLRVNLLRVELKLSIPLLVLMYSLLLLKHPSSHPMEQWRAFNFRGRVKITNTRLKCRGLEPLYLLGLRVINKYLTDCFLSVLESYLMQ
jgi:hypothetical protein